jgi:hypothetical protein
MVTWGLWTSLLVLGVAAGAGAEERLDVLVVPCSLSGDEHAR